MKSVIIAVSISENRQIQFSSYQAMVFCNPSRKSVFAWKPNSCLALVVSSIRRGWPSGLVASQVIFPLKSGQFHDQFRQVPDGYFKTGADVDGFTLVVFLRGKDNCLCRILT